MKKPTKFAAIFLILTFVLACGCAHAPVAPEKQTDYDAIIIGAGLGGLSAGAHLAVNGMKVLVLEQHHKIGGCTTSFSRGEFNFDAALHEMLGGEKGTQLGDLLIKAGVYDKVELIRIPQLYRSIGPGVDFTVPADFEGAKKALCEGWPDECRDIERFFETMKKINDDARELEDLYRLDSAMAAGMFLKTIFNQQTLVKHFLTPLGDLLDSYFKSEELKLVISQLWVYYGPPPSKLWSIMFMSANYGYMTEGAFQIKGSSQALADAYAERIREMGGIIKTGTLVTKIHVENNRAQGVTTEMGDTYTARYVISNADPFQTFFKLVGKEKTPKKMADQLKKMKPGNSIVGVYMGLDVEPSFWNCTDHEIFYNTHLDPDENYRTMMEGNYENSASAITFYTNLGDPFYAPKGKSVLVLHAYSSIDKWPKDRKAYLAMKERVADQLISLAENVFPGLKEHILVKEIITPRTLEAFTMQKDGIPYGWDFTVDQGLRLSNRTPIGGLFLAGSWTNPGHGVSTTQISGYQAARIILDIEGVK